MCMLQVRIKSAEEYQRIVDAEWTLIFEKLEIMAKSGAKVVLSRLPIGDVATQYFADRDIFCAGRVEETDLNRTAQATRAQVQTTVNKLSMEVLGSCGEFEEVQLGCERFNIFRECPCSQSATIILRGGALQFLEEAERSVHDAIEVVRRCKLTHTVVGGGGAVELELSRFLRDYASSVHGKEHMIVLAFAKALEIIPRTLAANSGFDPTDVINLLRQQHHRGTPESRWLGVDCNEGTSVDTMEACIFEPALVKYNALSSATEAACLVLSIDETVRNPRSEQGPPGGGMGGGGMPRGGMGRGGMGRGRGMRSMRGRGGR
eukprot:GHVR01173624.1.p1 GENE.GHVR01173624.1~~GHVR01173624.1.p1  ORF type:complete len:319 (+),score=85.60 GHVR01173624.1:793-1749(+)